MNEIKQHIYDLCQMNGNKRIVASFTSVYKLEVTGTLNNIPKIPPMFPPMVTAASTHIAGKLILLPTTFG